jgi:hypothetical protein
MKDFRTVKLSGKLTKRFIAQVDGHASNEQIEHYIERLKAFRVNGTPLETVDNYLVSISSMDVYKLKKMLVDLQDYELLDYIEDCQNAGTLYWLGTLSS